ncbi:sigma-54 interaction domain-containing protein [Candidatus Omnitrophota bacterium]
MDTQFANNVESPAFPIDEKRNAADGGSSLFCGIVGGSEKMINVFDLIGKVAPTYATVLVTGESGTGKELAAKAIHALSPRKTKPFITINCSAIPIHLLESELFGHEKGSFTDAYEKKIGKFEVADGGTVFLDEIGEMTVGLQVKILRFLQEKTIERVGGNTPIELDVRVLAATNSDLKKKIDGGLFRSDLYYRLTVINIEMPPLRERGDDILLLADHFLNKYKHEVTGKATEGFTRSAKDAFMSHSWPGNVREMENLIRRTNILTTNGHITRSELGFTEGGQQAGSVNKLSLREARKETETSLINRALYESKNNMSLAAKMLGITRPTLYDLIKKYRINI